MAKRTESIASGLAAVLLASAPTAGQAICLNPFGCAPHTTQECLQAAGEAKTEAAARTLIQACRAQPPAPAECAAAENRWATYMSKHDGVQWDFPEMDLKERCQASDPKTFAPSLWVTAAYCSTHQERLNQSALHIDSATSRSLTLDAVRNQHVELTPLSDRQMVEALQSVYYPNVTPARVAESSFVDAPPDGLAVWSHCKALGTGRPATK